MHNVSTHSNRARHGTSLVEVLVVLVVLVVGVLAIARLFPAGFLSLRGAENNSYAGRLAQGALDVLKQNNTSLADGVYMYLPDGTFDPNYSPALPDNSSGIVGTPAYLKPYPGNAAYNDINKERYISNETVTVPAARSGANYGLYALNFGPFDPTIALTVNGTLWTAQNGDSRLNASDPSGTATLDNPVDILQPGQQDYLVDLNTGQIAVPPAAYPQTFVLTVNGGTPVTVKVATNTVPTAAYLGGWFSTDGGTTTDTTATPYTVTAVGAALPAAPWATAELYRPYQYMGSVTSIPANFWSADPYEYALYNPSGGPNGMQTLAFNPLAGGRVGVSPLQARLSYSTQDWHILHEDRDVPAIATGDTTTIRLALSGLKKVGDVQFDQTLFNGLGGSGYDIYLEDRDTGKFYGLIGSGTGQNALNTDDNSGPTAPGTIGVSYLNGRITLPDTFSTDDPLPPLPSPRMKHLRIFYAGTADWAVAVQKAPKSYASVGNAAAVSAATAQTPNRYWLDTAGKRIAFPICDSGKMVQITLGAQPPLSANIPTTTMPGQTVQYVDVSSIYPASGSPAVTVTGLSARALVIWHERDQWKTRSIDTLLTNLN